MTRGVIWPAQNAFRARCLPSDDRPAGERHRAPDEGCRCGVYGLEVGEGPSLQDAQSAVRAADGVGLLPGGEVLGLVEGYGEVFISERGWRAEFARVVALFPADLAWSFVTTRTLEAIAARYRVPIIYQASPLKPRAIPERSPAAGLRMRSPSRRTRACTARSLVSPWPLP